MLDNCPFEINGFRDAVSLAATNLFYHIVLCRICASVIVKFNCLFQSGLTYYLVPGLTYYLVPKIIEEGSQTVT